MESGATASSGVPLTGREVELGRLVSWWGAVADGSAPTMVVEGEAGIGKSTLLAAAMAGAAPSVLTGSCDDLDQTRPFAALVAALADDPVVEEVRHLLSADGDARGVVDASYVATEAFVDAVEARAVTTPLVLAIDDLHWADPSTLVVLRELHRRLTGLPFALLVLLRPAPRSEALDRFLESVAPIERINLGPLPATDVHRVARAMLGAVPGEALRSELARAAGNPLYVLELLAALDADGHLERRRGGVELVETAFPAGLRHAVLRRLADLPPATVDALRSAALLGATFTVTDVAIVIKRDIGDLALQLVEAVKSGVLVEDGDELAFRHDIVREAIEADLPAPVRVAMHLAIGLDLERAGAPRDRVAPHLLLGGSAGGGDAVDAIERTALALRHVAPIVALDLFDVALALVPEATPRWDELVGPTLSLLIRHGRLSEAEAHIRTVLARPHDPALSRLLRHGLHACLQRSGRLQEREAELARMLGGDELGEGERADLEASFAFSRLMNGDAAGARALAERAKERAAGTQELNAQMGAELTLSWVELADGRSTLGVEHAQRAAALEASRAAPDREYALPVDLQLGVALADADDISACVQTLRIGLRRALDRGDPGGAATHQWGLCAVAYLAADWDGCLVEGEAGLQAVADGQGSELGLLLAYGVMGRALCRLGRMDEAEERLAAGEELLARNAGGFGADWLLWGIAGLASAQGDVDRAFNVMTAAWDLTGGVRYFLLWRHLAPDLVRGAVATGDRQRAVAVTEIAVEGAARSRGLASAEAAALQCQGLLAGDADILVSAAERARSSERRVVHIDAAADAVRALQRAGRARDAASLARSVPALAESSGGTARPEIGWAALTPAERRVVDVVAEGLTNGQAAARLFVSRYTVETHLKRVFPKLEVSNRYELIALVARR